jgi:glycosyltransferase involved in cell wall biosynthesis
MVHQVIFVDETAQIGGAEINLLTILPSLASGGWGCGVILPQEGPFSQNLSRLNISVYEVPRLPLPSTSFYIRHRYKLPNPLAFLLAILGGLVWLARLYRFFKQTRPAVVQTISMWSHAFAGGAARLAGCPVIWHFQDIIQPSAGLGLYRRLMLLWARWIPDRIICISDKVAGQFEANPVLRRKVKVLWNTVDTQRFAPTEAEPRSTSQKAVLKIGTVARLTPWKGQELALQAARLLKKDSVQFHWYFAGDESLGSPGYYAHLQALIRQWGLEQEVEFLGWVDNIPALYHSLEVLVHLPTEPEPFGLVLAEAMASGLTVIATQGGGAEPLVLASGGTIVPVDRPEAVAQTLAALWQTPEELARRRRLARRFAEQQFGLQNYLQTLLELYESVLKPSERSISPVPSLGEGL